MTELAVSKIKQLEQALQLHPGVAFAVLVGSQRTGLAHAQSDWDIAVQWREALSLMEKLAQTELLRHELKNLLNVEEQQVDLIDTAHARLWGRWGIGHWKIPCGGCLKQMHTNSNSATLRVAVNAVPLLFPLTGIGQYVNELMLKLKASQNIEANYFYANGWSNQLRHKPLSFNSNLLKIAVRRFLPKSYEMSRWLQQHQFTKGINQFKPDVYHEPNFLAFDFDGPTVLTVHDLSWIRFPQAHPPERVRAMHKFFEPSLAKANHIITDSLFVKQELMDEFGLNPAMIHPIHLAAEPLFKPMESSETAAFLNSKGLSHSQYWLAVGTLEPRKNLQLALHAFAALPAADRQKTPLVLAGMVGWQVGDLLHKMKAMQQAGELLQLGYVSRHELAAVVASAKALIFPSVYEGFGLPLVEAMQCGTPVLASNASCLPEVLEGAGLLFDPHDADALKAFMLQMLADDELAATLSAQGLERAKHFGWHKTAQQTFDTYRLAVG